MWYGGYIVVPSFGLCYILWCIVCHLMISLFFKLSTVAHQNKKINKVCRVIFPVNGSGDPIKSHRILTWFSIGMMKLSLTWNSYSTQEEGNRLFCQLEDTCVKKTLSNDTVQREGPRTMKMFFIIMLNMTKYLIVVV